MDSTCVLIGLQVCFHSAMKHENWGEQCGLTVLELWEFTVGASYIVFLFVNNENNNFIKEIKHVLPAFIACWKPWQRLWEFSSRRKPETDLFSTASRIFTDLLSNSPKCSPRFSPGYESTENMFYFLSNDKIHYGTEKDYNDGCDSNN